MVKLPDERPHMGHQQISTDFWKTKLISLISTICTLQVLIEEQTQREGKSCKAAAFVFIWSFKDSLEEICQLQYSQPDVQPLENWEFSWSQDAGAMFSGRTWPQAPVFQEEGANKENISPGKEEI